jgi:hypothetical protein
MKSKNSGNFHGSRIRIRLTVTQPNAGYPKSQENQSLKEQFVILDDLPLFARK